MKKRIVHAMIGTAMGVAMLVGITDQAQTAQAATWHSGTPSFIRNTTMRFKEGNAFDRVFATKNTITYKTPYRTVKSYYAKYATSGNTTVVKGRSGGYSRWYKFKKVNATTYNFQFSEWYINGKVTYDNANPFTIAD